MTEFQKKTAKRLWEIGVIVLLNIALLCAAGDVRMRAFFGGDRSVFSQLGDESEEVRRVQKKLKTLGFYSGEVSGFYSLETLTAVKKFQKENGLDESGKANGETLKLLKISPENITLCCDAEVLLLARFIESAAAEEQTLTKLLIGSAVVNRTKSTLCPPTLPGVIFCCFGEYISENFFEEPSGETVAIANACLNGTDPSGGADAFCKGAFVDRAMILAECDGWFFYTAAE